MIGMITAAVLLGGAGYCLVLLLRENVREKDAWQYRMLLLKSDKDTILTAVEVIEDDKGRLLLGVVAADEISEALREAREHGVLAVVQSDDSGVSQTGTFIGNTFTRDSDGTIHHK